MRMIALIVSAAVMAACASHPSESRTANDRPAVVPVGSASTVASPAVEPAEPAGSAVPPAADSGVPPRVGGRRVIVPSNGSTPQILGTQRGQIIIAVDGPFTLEGVAFPLAIGSYQRGKVVDYGSAGGGYSVNYGRQGGVFATCYVYGDGVDDAREMADVLAAIRHHYAGAQLVTADTISLKVRGRARPAQYARVSFRRDGALLLSDSVVLSLDGSFIKLRITGTEAEWASSERVVRRLLDGMGLNTGDWI